MRVRCWAAMQNPQRSERMLPLTLGNAYDYFNPSCALHPLATLAVLMIPGEVNSNAD